MPLHKKSPLNILITSFAIILILLLSWKIATLIHEKNESFKKKSYLPDIELYSVNKSFFLHSINDNKPTVLIFFYLNCEYCEDLIENLKLKLNELVHVQIILITIDDRNLLKGFIERHDLMNHKELKLFYCNTQVYTRAFGDNFNFPMILLYDKNKVQVKKYIGDINVKCILNDLKSIE